jgi:DNA-binding transcriptional MocR family regulator
MKLYEQLAESIADRIRDGSLAPGERVPSVRQLRAGRGVSPATVMRAFELLETRGLIEVRPRSGYYVSARPALAHEPRASRPALRSTHLDVSELVFEVIEALRVPGIVPLGSAFPNPALFPLASLARHLGAAARGLDAARLVDDLASGSLDLRRQIAQRYLRFGAEVSPDEIVITSGAMEALTLGLQVLTRPGDLVAIESPAFYGCLQAVEALGLRAIEIPTHAREGVDLDALATVLARHPVRACWFMNSFQNPLGALMRDDTRQALVRLLDRHDVALIEDDVYAELYFGERRPQPTKSFDRDGRVLDCGSFSKCLAPGYRVGWVAAGRYATQVARRKFMSSIATPVPNQLALASYLRRGGFDRHLKALRRKLVAQQAAAIAALHEHLPPGFRITRPEGGYFLWVELPGRVDTIALFHRLLTQGVSIAPGPIFSARREFGNCLRLNFGYPSTADFARAVAKLGRGGEDAVQSDGAGHGVLLRGGSKGSRTAAAEFDRVERWCQRGITGITNGDIHRFPREAGKRGQTSQSLRWRSVPFC